LGKERIAQGYRKTGKPFIRFAARQAKKWRGEVVDIDAGFPAVLAVRKDVLLEHGLSDRFGTPAILLDLQRRLADAGLKTVCAKQVYVHTADISGREFTEEKQAVLEILSARKSLVEEGTDASLKHLNRALGAKAAYAEALYERGLVLSMAGDDREAMADFARVLELRPSDSRAGNNLGCLHFGLGQLEEAEARFRKAVADDPENWEAKKNLADLLLHGGRTGEATAMYTSLVQEHGQRHGVCASVAEVFASLGDLETAEHLFGMSLRIFPEDETALRGLSAVRTAKGCPKNAGGDRVDVG
jgi:Flp pilus assembly protein TadD